MAHTLKPAGRQHCDHRVGTEVPALPGQIQRAVEDLQHTPANHKIKG